MDNATQTDNSTQTEEVHSSEQQASVAAPTQPQVASTDTDSIGKSWQSQLAVDYRNSPLVKKFEDTPDGLANMVKSHENLEKLLGHDKVPIPKGLDDKEGWNRFSKAMGIPDKAENYGLPDAQLPNEIKDYGIDKREFAEIVHAHKLTPAQAKGLWTAYQEKSIQDYNKAMEAHQGKITENINRLKGEWGDAYDTNVQLGQTVINKFSDSQEMNDYITAVMTQDPRGIKFLAKIGNEFAENKLGDFAMQKFSLAPEEAQAEIDKMVNDLEGPYMNVKSKYTEREHTAAIDRVNSLRMSIARARKQGQQA